MKFCVTTPIYYINGDPHIGHAYASIAADIIARFARLDGLEVHFSTGTDEHGIKVARSAESVDMDVHEFSDIMSKKFRDMSDKINMSYDDFIRTTEKRHEKAAQTLWKMIEKDIYCDTYAGWYSARDEEYVTESDIVDGKTTNGAPVEWMEEASYFFRLSDYQDKLLDWYEKNPNFILPTSRRNEVISFVRSGLKDLSISRSKFTWGIPIPHLDGHVMYVWIDALTNYITSLGYPDPEKADYIAEMMKSCVHVVGKEILRFHAVYWPAFLMSAGLPLPKRVYAHGWWTSEGQKMSKSVGNVVDPHEVIGEYGLDPVRYFLFREIKFGEDGDFSRSAIEKRISFDLANDLGNLVQRVLAFIQKTDGRLVVDYDFSADERTLFENSRSLVSRMRPLMDKQDLHASLSTVWELIAESNKFVNDMRPWELVKNNPKKLNKVITALCESIRSIGFGLAPFMPDTARKIFDFINVDGKLFQEIQSDFVNQNFRAPFMLFPKKS
ncbi:MAG: methionine--tRNA ligase [Holosporaceae bacterium]|jgi:methionyl-tRNA synthetase|nr:methionine--tRNA ligase [Holosporaceae bacterium]